jgi:hypothetical protein
LGTGGSPKVHIWSAIQRRYIRLSKYPLSKGSIRRFVMMGQLGLTLKAVVMSPSLYEKDAFQSSTRRAFRFPAAVK